MIILQLNNMFRCMLKPSKFCQTINSSDKHEILKKDLGQLWLPPHPLTEHSKVVKIPNFFVLPKMTYCEPKSFCFLSVRRVFTCSRIRWTYIKCQPIKSVHLQKWYWETKLLVFHKQNQFNICKKGWI